MQPTKLTVDDVKGRLDRKEPIVFIDSRNAKAWGESDVKLPGALRVPADEVAAHLGEIPRDRTLITYCT
ncbi:MAG: rhodanese-like domain-containing protein [Acidobacteriota bacterium]